MAKKEGQGMKVLVVLGHPRPDSFCGALTDAFSEGARAAGVQLHRLDLWKLDFDPDVHTSSPNSQPLEDDLKMARDLVYWADHLVFVYPTWWGTTPALLKGFLDRILSPGFAFNVCEGGIGYQGLLNARSAQLITTMDTPPLIHRLLYRQPGRNAMARATLGFCGIRPVRSLVFGSVKDASEQQRSGWIARANRQGRRLSRGRITLGERLKYKSLAWLRALRLQFYPMTWVAYAIGALAIAGSGSVFGSSIFWLGYLCLFLLEVATVLSNELVDLPSDQSNRFYSAFTGGSRVLVEGLLSPREVKAGIIVSFLGFLFCLAWVLAAEPGLSWMDMIPVGALAILAIGYTAPPLKLSYRGLGELDVAITHSIGVMLCGYVFMGGAWSDLLPWLLSLPLLLAIVPAITLSGLPDLEADEAAGKGTLAVRLGRTGAYWVAIGFTLLAAVVAVVWQFLGLAGGVFGGIAVFVLPHGGWLLWRLVRHIRTHEVAGRIDGLMAISLGYVLWFGLVPMFQLVGG